MHIIIHAFFTQTFHHKTVHHIKMTLKVTKVKTPFFLSESLSCIKMLTAIINILFLLHLGTWLSWYAELSLVWIQSDKNLQKNKLSVYSFLMPPKPLKLVWQCKAQRRLSSCKVWKISLQARPSQPRLHSWTERPHFNRVWRKSIHRRLLKSGNVHDFPWK